METVRETPQVSVRIGGSSDIRAFTERVIEVRVQNRLSSPALCELVCIGSDHQNKLEIGAEVAVSFTHGGEHLFEGEVTALTFEKGADGQALVRIRAYDRIHRLKQSQSVREFSEKSTREIVSEIVGPNGLSVQMEENGPLWHHIVQLRESDFQFLRKMAERTGLYFFLAGKNVHFVSARGAGAPVALHLQSDIIEIRVEQNANRSCRSVEANGWDPWTAVPTTAIATQPGVAGAERPSPVADLALRLFGLPFQNVEQARATAQHELDNRSSAEHTVWGLAHGSLSLQVGGLVRIAAQVSGFEGAFLLSGVTHTIDSRAGFVTEFDSFLPEPEPNKEHAEVTIGKVVGVNDPDKLGRIKLELPFHGGLRTDWLQVVLPAAGSDKGLIALPDNGDQVLVLMVSGDPSQGLVLGGVYGSNTPSDHGVHGNKVGQYFFRTPGGQQIELDDDDDSLHLTQKDGASIDMSKDSIRLSTAGGSYLSMAKSRVVLHANSDLTIEAPGRKIRIAGDAVDFDRS